MNLKSINKRIINRKDVFYWQSERRISEAEAGEIWKDRHSAIKNSKLIKIVNSCLKEDECVSIDEFDNTKQESLGGINSNRVGRLKSGKEVIVRCHPMGVKNGYFYVESLVAQLLIDNNLPSYKTYAIHECENEHDCAFQVIEKLNGINVELFLKQNPKMEEKIVYEMGKTAAKINQIEVEGFGPFNNDLAKRGKLKGIFNSLYKSVVAGLDYDLNLLVRYNIITKQEAKSYKKIFSTNKVLLQREKAVLVHNDFIDWNSLTDGKAINGILDLDECVASDPISEIACFSLFFNIDRLDNYLKGYFSVVEKPVNFEQKFQLLRLRYTLSKMTLRLKKFTYEPSEDIKFKIEVAKNHLNDCSKFFGVID